MPPRRLLGALLLFAASVAAQARDLPPAVLADAPELDLHGSAEMRHLGFKVYTARLWTGPDGYVPGQPFALDIEYAMSLDGADLVEASVEEMRDLGIRDEGLLARWAGEMAAAFPDVKKGDRLVGLAVPGVEARFYSSRGRLATIRDPAFVDAFFSIWLAEQTSAPEVRAGLLGAATRRP